MHRTIAYRTYLIHHNSVTDMWWITKAGHHISHAKDEADAKSIINQLLD